MTASLSSGRSRNTIRRAAKAEADQWDWVYTYIHSLTGHESEIAQYVQPFSHLIFVLS